MAKTVFTAVFLFSMSFSVSAQRIDGSGISYRQIQNLLSFFHQASSGSIAHLPVACWTLASVFVHQCLDSERVQKESTKRGISQNHESDAKRLALIKTRIKAVQDAILTGKSSPGDLLSELEDLEESKRTGANLALSEIQKEDPWGLASPQKASLTPDTVKVVPEGAPGIWMAPSTGAPGGSPQPSGTSLSPLGNRGINRIHNDTQSQLSSPQKRVKKGDLECFRVNGLDLHSRVTRWSPKNHPDSKEFLEQAKTFDANSERPYSKRSESELLEEQARHWIPGFHELLGQTFFWENYVTVAETEYGWTYYVLAQKRIKEDLISGYVEFALSGEQEEKDQIHHVYFRFGKIPGNPLKHQGFTVNPLASSRSPIQVKFGDVQVISVPNIKTCSGFPVLLAKASRWLHPTEGGGEAFFWPHCLGGQGKPIDCLNHGEMNPKPSGDLAKAAMLRRSQQSKAAVAASVQDMKEVSTKMNSAPDLSSLMQE